MLIKLLKLVGNLIYVYTLLLSYSLYYKIEDYFIIREHKPNDYMRDPSDYMRDDDWDDNYSKAEAADYSVREDEVLGDNWPHIAYSLHHQSKKEGTK